MTRYVPPGSKKPQDLLLRLRVGIEKLSRDVEWAAKFFVRSLKILFSYGPPPGHK